MCIYVDQRTTLRCQFSSLPGGSQEWNSGHQVCWRGSLPAGPYYPLCLGLLWAGLSYFVSSIRCSFFFLLVVLETGPRGSPMLDKVLLQSSSYTVQGMCSGSATRDPDAVSESPPLFRISECKTSVPPKPSFFPCFPSSSYAMSSGSEVPWSYTRIPADFISFPWRQSSFYSVSVS